MPLAVTGVDRVVAVVWGICIERYTAGNSLESSRPSFGPLLFQSSWYNTRTQGSPLSQYSWYNTRTTSAAFWGICTERYTAGNSLELGRYPSGTPPPILPGVTPGPKDRLRRRPPWNLWKSDDSPSGSTSPPLSGIIPGPQDSIFLASSFGSHICTIRYSECVCVCVSLKTILRRVLLCLVFREQFIPPGIVFIFSENNWYY